MKIFRLGTLAAFAFTLGCAPATSQSGLAIPDFSGGWIDATATLDPSTTPVYEGDAPMKFDFLHDMRKGDAFTLSAYSMGAHSGTHIDAPMHFVREGASIEQLPLDALIGPARVIDIPDAVQAIDANELNKHDWRGAPAPLTHRTLLGRNIPIVEGLALDHISAGDYDLIVLPIKVGGHEGAPARAVLRARSH